MPPLLFFLLLLPQGTWNKFVGRPGGTYNLLSTGDGASLGCRFEAGGLKGQATFVRRITFQKGLARATVLVSQVQGRWVLTGARLRGGVWRCGAQGRRP